MIVLCCDHGKCLQPGRHFTFSYESNPAKKSPDSVLLQVGYGLVSRWRSQLGSQQTLRRLGLQDLLKHVGLSARQSKSGDEPIHSAICNARISLATVG